MSLSVSATNIKSALSIFGEVSCVVLKPAGVWQYVVVYFKELDAAAFALNHWSILVGKDSVCIFLFINQNETILLYGQFKTKLVNLFSGCTVFEISNMISQVGGWTCFIPYSSNSGHCSQFALIIFGFQVDLDFAVVKTGTLKKYHIWWETPGCQCCFRCQKVGHLAVDCKVSLPSPPKAPKVFRTCFVNGVSYAKASVFLNSSEFLLLVVSTSPFIIIGDSLMFFWLAFLESDLVKLFALVESIVKPVGSLVKLFKQFINENLASSSTLGLKINEVMVHMGSFSKIVGKLGRKMVSLKKECYIEDINMFGDSEHSVVLDDQVFFNLMFL
ncbi:hypothetical protein G9A89_012931 [Geosiphon pyriformis]|nr:hypothetical protein G9A89_012931 [Geosiphon pyriformis]